jgi:hypothetical protein
LNGDGAVGLLGEFAGFNVDGFGPYLSRYFVWHNISIMPVDPEELHSTPAGQTLNEISQCQRASVWARLVVVQSTPDRTRSRIPDSFAECFKRMVCPKG